MSASGRSAAFDGAVVIELVSAASTDGRVAVQEHRGAPGFGHPMHAHTLEDEVLYVIEGVVEVTSCDVVTRAEVGTCVPLRRHVPHAWRIVSDGGRLLITTVPGAFADFFLEAAGGDPWRGDDLARRGVVLSSGGNGSSEPRTTSPVEPY